MLQVIFYGLSFFVRNQSNAATKSWAAIFTNTKCAKISGMKTETAQTIISRSPDVMSGTPVFAGTRVPVQSLLDYLAGGHPLEEFLEDFPTVSREQALELLHKLNESLATAQI